METKEIMMLEYSGGWMAPIIQFMSQDKLSNKETEARHIKRISSQYLVVAKQLYKMDRSFPTLRCVTEEEVGIIMKEVHEGVCGSHIWGRALSRKILRIDYYWLSMLQDYT